jgi:hypothetical protein
MTEIVTYPTLPGEAILLAHFVMPTLLGLLMFEPEEFS